jgi:HD-GYP domain-containing protein (c-di-GMP phosphodiesterase class II)
MNEFIKRNSILEKKRIYQFGFFIVLLATLMLHLIVKIDPSFFVEGALVVVCILLGIGFRQIHIGYIVIVTAVLTYLDGYIDRVDFRGIDVLFYFLHWILYLVVTSMIRLMIERYLNKQEETLALVLTLSKALDARDPYTAFHSENVAKYAVMIAEKLKLPPRTCYNIFIGALLHDIGKIGVPEAILNKPNPLTTAEFEAIKQHPKAGYDMINHISKFKKHGQLDIVLYHHERYDGQGYPFGLKEYDIPLAARIVSVADSFDSKRVYSQESLSKDAVINDLKTNSGTQFDPIIAKALIDLIEEEKIAAPTTRTLLLAGNARGSGH